MDSRGNLAGEVALVTGAASGIGRELSYELARRGACVIMADIAADEVREASRACDASSEACIPASLDVADASAVEGLVQSVVEEHGRLDYMFNNAGIASCGEVRDLAREDWESVLDVDLWGVIHGTTSAYRLMAGQGFGHIVNTASLGGIVPEPFAAPYSASKFAVVGLTLALRVEARDLGVKASVFCPSFVKTNVLENARYVGVSREDALREMGALPSCPPERAVRRLLSGVTRNRAVITDGVATSVLLRLYRTSPTLFEPLLRQGVKDLRAIRHRQAASIASSDGKERDEPHAKRQGRSTAAPAL